VAPASGEDEDETAADPPPPPHPHPGESELDESLEESFPSSDPPSSWAGPDPDE
jgi:hypothetical protein